MITNPDMLSSITAVVPLDNKAKDIDKIIKSVLHHVSQVIVVSKSDRVDNLVSQEGIIPVSSIYGVLDSINWYLPNQYILMMHKDEPVIDANDWFNRAKSMIYPQRDVLSQKAIKMSKIRARVIRVIRPKLYRELFVDKAVDDINTVDNLGKLMSIDKFLHSYGDYIPSRE